MNFKLIKHQHNQHKIFVSTVDTFTSFFFWVNSLFILLNQFNNSLMLMECQNLNAINICIYHVGCNTSVVLILVNTAIQHSLHLNIVCIGDIYIPNTLLTVPWYIYTGTRSICHCPVIWSLSIAYIYVLDMQKQQAIVSYSIRS